MMSSLISILRTGTNRVQGEDLIFSTVIMICVFALFIAITVNFMISFIRDNTSINNGGSRIAKENKSIVETGSMTAFFVIFYLILKSHILSFHITVDLIRLIVRSAGVLFIVAGCIMNIAGRISLGNNWGNQIRIYKNHTLIRSGIYSIVRHPLYASIMLMFYGAGIVYMNISSILSVTFIFIPFMYCRAKQEETLLVEKFGDDYRNYVQKVGMLFPKFVRRGLAK